MLFHPYYQNIYVRLLNKSMIRCFDLFAGIGGFRLATEKVSAKTNIIFKTIGWSEIDKYCQKTYNSYFNTEDNYFIDDIKKITSPNNKFCDYQNYKSIEKSKIIKNKGCCCFCMDPRIIFKKREEEKVFVLSHTHTHIHKHTN